MKLFLHSLSKIRIINGDQEWTGTPGEFQALEPTYPGLPILTQAPAVCRYQSPEIKYIEDSQGTRHADLFDALPYCDRLGQYAPGLSIWVHVQISATALCADDPAATIQAAAHFRQTDDPASPLLPITAGWLIKLRHESGAAVDLFQVNFVNGEMAFVYTFRPGLPIGDWYLNEADFGSVTVNGQEYKVRLAAPVRFAVYRLLA